MGQDLSLKVILQAQDLASNTVKSFGSTLMGFMSGPQAKLLGGMLAIAGAAVAIGVQSVQAAAQFQASMNSVQALTGASNAQMAQYDSQLKALAINAGVAPTALASGLYNVVSAGYSGAQAMNVLTLATEDAKIGMTDATTTTNGLTNILKSFNVSAADTTRVNGEMLETVTLGKATFAQYASNITKAASSSTQFHVSMETMNAAWATLTSSGISAGQATTDYAQSLKVMYGNIGTVTKSLDKNGISFNEAKFNAMSYGDKVQYLNGALQQAAAKHVSITGATVQATQAIQTISQHIGTYNSNLATLSDKQAMNNKTQSAWAITQNGLSQQMSRAGAAVQVLFIDIGQKLLPVLTQIASKIAPTIQGFINFASAMSHNQVAMDFLKGAMAGFVALMLMILVPAFWAWATAAGAAALATLAATWPLILIAAGIALLVAGIILLIQHWGAVVAWLKGVWGAIVGFFQGLWERILQGLAAVGAFFQGIWSDITTGVGNFFSALGTLVHNGMEAILNFFLAPIRAVVNLFNWLYQHNTYFKELIDKIHAIITIGLEIIRMRFFQVLAWIVGLWSSLKDKATQAWNAVTGAITTAVMFVVNWVRAQIQKHVEDIQQKFFLISAIVQQAWQKVQAVIQGAWNNYIVTPLNNLWNNIVGFANGWPKQALQWGINLVQGFINGIKNMAGAVGNAAQGIIKNVASFLGFHSPAAQGEGQHIIEWGSNMIKGFSSGVTAAIPQLQAAVNLAVSTGTRSLSPAGISSSGIGAIPYGQPPAGNSYNYNSSAGGNTHNGDIIIQGAGQNAQQIIAEMQKQQNFALRRSGSIGNPANGRRNS